MTKPSQRQRLSRSMPCVAAHAHTASAVSCRESQLGQTKPRRGGTPTEWRASCRRTSSRLMLPLLERAHLIHGLAQPSKRHFTCDQAARGAWVCAGEEATGTRLGALRGVRGGAGQGRLRRGGE